MENKSINEKLPSYRNNSSGDSKVDRDSELEKLLGASNRESTGIHYYPGAGEYAPSTVISGRT